MAIVVGASPAETLKYCIKHEASAAILPLAKGRAEAGTGDYPSSSLNEQHGLRYSRISHGGGQDTVSVGGDGDQSVAALKGLAWCERVRRVVPPQDQRAADERMACSSPASAPGGTRRCSSARRPRAGPRCSRCNATPSGPVAAHAAREAAPAKCRTALARARTGASPAPADLPAGPHPSPTRHPVHGRRPRVPGVSRRGSGPRAHHLRLDPGQPQPRPLHARAGPASSLGSGTAAARIEFAPRGEVDVFTEGAPAPRRGRGQPLDVDPPADARDCRRRDCLNLSGALDTVVGIRPAVTRPR